MTLFYFVLFLAFGIINLVFTLMILRELSAAQRGMSFFDLRWYVLKNLNRYREITREKYGRVGFAYYGYLATFGGMMLSAALLIDSLAR